MSGDDRGKLVEKFYILDNGKSFEKQVKNKMVVVEGRGGNSETFFDLLCICPTFFFILSSSLFSLVI